MTSFAQIWTLVQPPKWTHHVWLLWRKCPVAENGRGCFTKNSAKHCGPSNPGTVPTCVKHHYKAERSFRRQGGDSMHWGLQETQWGFGTQGLQCTTSSRASREQRAQEKRQQCPAGLAGPRGARGGAQQQRPGMGVPTSLPIGLVPERRLSQARTPLPQNWCSVVGWGSVCIGGNKSPPSTAQSHLISSPQQPCKANVFPWKDWVLSKCICNNCQFYSSG